MYRQNGRIINTDSAESKQNNYCSCVVQYSTYTAMSVTPLAPIQQKRRDQQQLKKEKEKVIWGLNIKTKCRAQVADQIKGFVLIPIHNKNCKEILQA